LSCRTSLGPALYVLHTGDRHWRSSPPVFSFQDDLMPSLSCLFPTLLSSLFLVLLAASSFRSRRLFVMRMKILPVPFDLTDSVKDLSSMCPHLCLLSLFFSLLLEIAHGSFFAVGPFFLFVWASAAISLAFDTSEIADHDFVGARTCVFPRAVLSFSAGSFRLVLFLVRIFVFSRGDLIWFYPVPPRCPFFLPTYPYFCIRFRP